MNKYELRLQLNNCNGGANSKPKWHVIMASNEKGYVNNICEAKGYFLNLCKNNPRLAVFKWDERVNRYINIYQDKKGD